MSHDRMKLPRQGDRGPSGNARAQNIAPGKVTQTSKLSAGPGSRPVQSKAVPAARAAAVQARPARTWSADFWMDATHRGSSALAEGSAPIPAKASEETADPPVRLPGTGGGAEMPGDVRDKMESSFGADFSSVRIHEGAHAPSIGALAYTQGTDIHFAPGQYRPNSQRGQELLGHELTHVVQQSQGRVQATTQTKGVDINDATSLEREADEMGARAARGEQVALSGPSGASGPAPIQRAVAPVVQMAGDYTGKMPKHETTGAPTYAKGDEVGKDYTYHHIIPENYIDEVYEKIAEALEALDGAQGGTAHGNAKAARDQFHGKGLGRWQQVRAKNTAHFVNAGWKNLPFAVRVSEADVLGVIQGTASTPDARTQGLVALLEPKITAPLRSRVGGMLTQVDGRAITTGSDEIGAIKDFLAPFISHGDNLLLMNAGNFGTDRKTPALRATNFRKVASSLAGKVAAADVIDRCFSYQAGWGLGALRAVAKEYALDDDEEKQEQLHGMMLWIPGNIHQGPKSSDRLQGDQNYHVNDDDRNDPQGYDRARDDGGGNFEWSARTVVGDEHFAQLTQLKAVLETLNATDDLDTDEAAQDIQRMFELMSALYDRGVTFFKDVNAKWGYDPDIGKMRLQPPDNGEQ